MHEGGAGGARHLVPGAPAVRQPLHLDAGARQEVPVGRRVEHGDGAAPARPVAAPALAPAAKDEEPERSAAEIPFYRKAIAHVRGGDDPNGFGPNWSNVDDYDIPTVLRKQMD